MYVQAIKQPWRKVHYLACGRLRGGNSQLLAERQGPNRRGGGHAADNNRAPNRGGRCLIGPNRHLPANHHLEVTDL
jgi:hypothetical protein